MVKMKLSAFFTMFLLLAPVLAFGVSPAIQTLKVNPKISPKEDITVRVYWNDEGKVKTTAHLAVKEGGEEEWLFLKPEEFELGPGSTESPDREVVWVYADIPPETPEGVYQYRISISTGPAEEEGFLSVRQDVVSILKVEVDHSYNPTDPGWHEPEAAEISTPMIAAAVVLVAVAVFIFLKV